MYTYTLYAIHTFWGGNTTGWWYWLWQGYNFISTHLESASTDVFFCQLASYLFKFLVTFILVFFVLRQFFFGQLNCLWCQDDPPPSAKWQAGVWSQLDIVSCPDCGFRRMEDWVVLAHGNAAKTRSLKRRESPQKPGMSWPGPADKDGREIRETYHVS